MLGGFQIATLLAGLAGAIAGGAVVWSSMSVREIIVTAAARKAGTLEATAACDGRIQDLARQQTGATVKGVGQATAAANEVAPTPTVPAEIIALCKRSASCLKETLP